MGKNWWGVSFDERQQQVRSRAYIAAFWTMSAVLLGWQLWETYTWQVWEPSFGVLLGWNAGLTVLWGWCILGGSYVAKWDSKILRILSINILLVEQAFAAWVSWDGMIVEGIVTQRAIHLVLAVQCLILDGCMGIRWILEHIELPPRKTGKGWLSWWVPLAVIAGLVGIGTVLGLSAFGGGEAPYLAGESPFQGARRYRVAQVLEGEQIPLEELPQVFLGSFGTSMSWEYSPYSDQNPFDLGEDRFQFVEPGDDPLRSQRKGLWVMEQEGDIRYELTVELDDSLVLTFLKQGECQWKWLLERLPEVVVAGTASGWYPRGTDPAEPSGPIGNYRLLDGASGLVELAVRCQEGLGPEITLVVDHFVGDRVAQRSETVTLDEHGEFTVEILPEHTGAVEYVILRIEHAQGAYWSMVSFSGEISGEHG